MSKKSKRRIKRSAGYVSRSRFIVSALSIVATGVLLTIYALSLYHMTTVVSYPPLSFSQSTDNDTSISSTTDQTTAATSLTQSNAESNETASYQSTNWAGYLATGGGFTAISGTWVMPHSSTTSTAVESGDGTWIGIGGVSTSDLIQIGTQNTISTSGVMTTTAFYELLPGDAVGIPSLSITPGDTISASITQTSANQWTLFMSDITTGQTFSTSVSYSSSLSSAEWIQEDPSYPDGSLVLLDNFVTVRFTSASTTMNGLNVSVAHSKPSPITMIGQGGAKGHSAMPENLNEGTFTVRYY